MALKQVAKQFYKDYFEKARQFLETAKIAMQNGYWTAATANAVHSAISSSDALSIRLSGMRPSGERHGEAVINLENLPLSEPFRMNLQKRKQQLQSILDSKKDAEYSERLISESDAREVFVKAERFNLWVKEVISKEVII